MANFGENRGTFKDDSSLDSIRLWDIDAIEVVGASLAAVPEPASFSLLTSSLAVGMLARRRK